MYKVSIPVLELALKNQKKERDRIAHSTRGITSDIKRSIASLDKSIKELKEILGK